MDMSTCLPNVLLWEIYKLYKTQLYFNFYTVEHKASNNGNEKRRRSTQHTNTK